MKNIRNLLSDTVIGIATRGEQALAGFRRHQRRSGGVNWVYLDSGGDRAPLVLIHGFGGDKSNWTRMCRYLRGHFRIIAPDLPGFGESEAPHTLRYRMQDHVERLRGFLADLGVARPHLGGNSMGGYIAALYAATHTAEVASLWLIDSAGIFTAAQSELQQTIASGGHNPLLPETPEQFRAVLRYAMSRPPHFPGFVLDTMARRALAASALRQSQFKDVLEESPHLEELLRGLPTPTHILWGDEDRLIHVDCVRVLRELLPNSSSTVLKGIGHIPMLEAPAHSARDYLAFRERLACGTDALPQAA
jgi:abhydrolase domain-containing protein 6